MDGFQTLDLPRERDVVAPDGFDVRLLLRTERGSMAHFALGPGRVSRAMVHRTVDEIWYVTAGRGEMWRRHGEREAVVSLRAGVCLTIPQGTAFQFRALGSDPFQALGVTMPPWPGPEEAVAVVGHWVTTE